MNSPLIATLSLAIIGAALCPAQPAATAPGNPRASSDDPRIGLKPGLYDAGEAAFGMERLASLPKPPGFAPASGGATEPFPAPDSPDTPPGQNVRTVQYGSANSDL